MFAVALLVWLEPPWWVWVAAVFSIAGDVWLALRLRQVFRRLGL